VAIALVIDRVDAAAAATNPGMITTNITFGAELQLQNGSPPLERTQGSGALIPDNVAVDDVAAAGDRLVIELLSNHTSAIEVRGIVRILPF
jgi:hypothetical protein